MKQRDLAAWALFSAVLGVAAVVYAYWLVVPAVVLGGAAVALGVAARRGGTLEGRGRDIATVAICLGAVAVLFTPVVLWHVKGGEDWGRHCALEGERDPHC